MWGYDPEDIAQERALAELEGRDPDEAERAYRQQQRRFYDRLTTLFPETQPARAPMVYRPNRSPEGIAKRLAYTREWWRKNGREYRQRRKES